MGSTWAVGGVTEGCVVDRRSPRNITLSRLTPSFTTGLPNTTTASDGAVTLTRRHQQRRWLRRDGPTLAAEADRLGSGNAETIPVEQLRGSRDPGRPVFQPLSFGERRWCTRQGEGIEPGTATP